MDYRVIHNLIDEHKCRLLIDISEAKGYDEADISYSTGAKMNKEYRDNYRCLYRNEELRLELEALLEPYIPKTLTVIREGGILDKKEFLKLSGNFRFYKYLPGQKFKKHRDGNQLEEGGVSLYTVLIYLNTPEEGGETGIFDGGKITVTAEDGKCLIFDHSILHTGEELLKGIKYVLRTDFIYKV